MLFVRGQNEQIDSLLLEIAFQKQDSAKVDASIKLIDVLYKAQDYKKAMLYIDQTLQLSNKIKYTKGSAEANYYRALIYTERDDYYNAIDGYSKSRDYFSQVKDTLGIAKVNNSIGLIEIKRGNYATGLNEVITLVDLEILCRL